MKLAVSVCFDIKSTKLDKYRNYVSNDINHNNFRLNET